jgi:hypothetical protein
MMSMSMDHGSEGDVDHGGALARDPGEGGEGETDGGVPKDRARREIHLQGVDSDHGGWRELLETDVTVRALLDDNHRPVEESLTAGFTVRSERGAVVAGEPPHWPGRIRCVTCQQPWPCDVRRALTERDKATRQERVRVRVEAMEAVATREEERRRVDYRPFWRRVFDALTGR